MMKLRGDALKLAIAIPLIIVFIIYVKIDQNMKETKFNQFINSYEGKSLVIQCLFHLEGIDTTVIEKHLQSKSIPILSRDLDEDYRIEKVIQYAGKELKITESDIKKLMHLIATSPKVTLSDSFQSDAFQQEYFNTTDLDVKIALIGVVLKNESQVWNK